MVDDSCGDFAGEKILAEQELETKSWNTKPAKNTTNGHTKSSIHESY